MKKKSKKKFGEVTRESVKKEMAKPRMAKSAREGIEAIHWANRAGQTCNGQVAVLRASSSVTCKVVCAVLL
jgi:hypothetical protein